MSLTEYFIKEVSDQLGLQLLFFEFILDQPGATGSSSSSSSSSDQVSWRFCNQNFDIDWNGATWYASSIRMSRIVQSSEINKDGVQLTFPRTDEFAQQFIGYVPEFLTFATIYRGHATQPDDEYAVYWKGRVAGGKANENTIEIACESVFTSLRRYGLQARSLRTCRHNLYKGGCRLDLADFATPVTITSGTISTLISSDFSSQADGYWIGGIIEGPGGAMRYIVGHVGDTITLWRPIPAILDALDIPETVPAIVYPGCNKSTQDCVNKFNNINNFGGFPLKPTRNPFDGRSII